MISQKELPSLETIWNIALDVCRSSCFTNLRNTFHGNLKPSNIFVDNLSGKLIAKVSDFGSSERAFRDITMQIRLTARTVSHATYSSPECLMRKK